MMYPDSAQRPADNRPAARRARQLVRAPGSRVWAWLLLMGVMSAGLWFTYRFFVTTSLGQILDQATLTSAELRLHSWHEASVALLAELPIVISAIAALGFLVLTLWRSEERRVGKERRSCR